MTMKTLAAALAASAFLFAAPLQAAQPADHSAHAASGSTDMAANLQALADRYVAEKKVANMVIGISHGDRMTHWVDAGTLSLNSDVPADEHSVYRIYSMTKPIIGLATALLVADGKIGLDQPISDFFPEFAEMHVLSDKMTPGETVAAKNAILVRHLVTHTAGLGYSIIPSGLQELYRKEGIVPGQRRANPLMPSGEQPTSLPAFMERLASLPLQTEPGTEWSYSIGLDVMGAVIEKASGMPLETFLQTRIFDPLKMDETGFVVPKDRLADLTTNYMIVNGVLTPIDNPNNSEFAEPAPFPSGGGGLVSTGEDYLRFMTALANGGMLEGQQVIPAEAVEMVTSNQLPRNVEYAGGGGYGMGGRVVTKPGNGPMGTYGWGGAAGTLASALPNENMAIVMMTQYMPSGSYPLTEDLMAALMADIAAMNAANDN